MEDEKPENEIEIEKNENTGEQDHPEEKTTEDEPSFRYSSSGRPYIRYTSLPRRGSIWNSPLGLAVVGILVSKGMDLAYRAFIEREKTKRTENQTTVQSPTKK
ncbi:hypothetical protein SEA_BING_46 [Streptomyces phage Bing]|uniref:Uncharacterized protein n=1 Tax=Streptomyces phage Bing TaxID=2079427 RepID=A0A2L1IWB8_9CAUD|nr:hypothetical protein FDJ31_gp46 [Streptomyces phage Bing]AVD99468.1 hypothetical protein SEA_BING_46 [Streptomyces phage Bing]